MKKKFFSDFFFIQIINLLIKPVWILIIDRKVQNLLPSESYGTYFSLTGFSLLFMIILDLGLSNYNNREVAIDRGFYKKNFWSVFGTKAILALLFFILASITGMIIGFTKQDFLIFGLLAINQCLLSFNTFFRSNISAIQHFKTDGILSVIDRLFVILSMGVIIWVGVNGLELDLYVFILSQTMGLILTFVISLWANFKYLGRAEFSFHYQAVKNLLSKSWPFALIIALMTFYTRLDSVLILKILPNGRFEAGNYAMSYRLLDAAAIIGILLAGQLMPLFSSSLQDKEKIRSILKYTMFLVLIPGILATFFCSIQGDAIMQLLYPEKYSEAGFTVFSILIWCVPGLLLINVYGTLLTAAGFLKELNYYATIVCFINLAGNLLFMKSYGLSAVAIVAVVTQITFGLLCYRKAISFL
ncbi:MAG: oligosaccharide flippase family protein [Flavobacteriales bacterium]|nr:oligosaccharide flippase family protein [Flavobacteriales bacterium]